MEVAIRLQFIGWSVKTVFVHHWPPWIRQWKWPDEIQLQLQFPNHFALQVSDYYMKIKTNYKLNLDSLYCMYVLYKDSLLSTVSISVATCQNSCKFKKKSPSKFLSWYIWSTILKNLPVWIFHQVLFNTNENNLLKGGFKSEDTREFLHLQHKYSKSLSWAEKLNFLPKTVNNLFKEEYSFEM